jgi:phosphoglucosamine mutase
MSGRYFGTDGIRGRANKFPMTAEIAMKVGMAAGLSFQRGSHRHRVVLGKDTRLSGYMIENALVAGLCAAGMDVFLLGPIPTPAVAMLVRSLRADIGVMISASHNPYYDNGIKLFGPDGYKLSDEIEERIEAMLDEDVEMALADSDSLGRAKRVDGVHDRYIEFAKRTLPRAMSLSGLRIVVDCANGAAYKVAPAALWELGADVVAINVDPNGFNINKDCGSTHPADLQKKVHEVRADIGIALDGDADRVVIVDENGVVVDGDQIMALIAESWHQNGRLAGGGVVSTVMSNLGLERFLTGMKLQLHRTKVGDRHVVEHMRAPHRPFRFFDHGRRPGLGPASAGLRQASEPPGQRTAQEIRAGAAIAQECALLRRQAARGSTGQGRDRGSAEPARQEGPTGHSPLRHRAAHPRHGRRRRPQAGRRRRQRHRWRDLASTQRRVNLHRNFRRSFETPASGGLFVVCLRARCLSASNLRDS